MGKKKLWLAGAGIVLVALLGWVFTQYFAPQPTTQVTHELSDHAKDGTIIRRGQFVDGDATHSASGSVSLIQHAGGYSLRFENYDATSGPDVFFFLSKSEAGDFEGAPKHKLLVNGGVGEGQATLRGDFEVSLSGVENPEQYRSVIAWCVRFSHRFGWAGLKPAE